MEQKNTKTLIRKTDFINISIYLLHMETHKRDVEMYCKNHFTFRRKSSLMVFHMFLFLHSKYKTHFLAFSRSRNYPSLNRWKERDQKAKKNSLQRQILFERVQLQTFQHGNSVFRGLKLTTLFAKMSFHVKPIIRCICTHIQTQI